MLLSFPKVARRLLLSGSLGVGDTRAANKLCMSSGPSPLLGASRPSVTMLLSLLLLSAKQEAYVGIVLWEHV